MDTPVLLILRRRASSEISITPCGTLWLLALRRNHAEELDIAAAVVDSLDDAVAHIRRYSTGHTESIITGSQRAAREFTGRVDAAAVIVNASTRFTDGGEFGFGAEIGISTQKLHARGPMGLPELTSTKYVVVGDGQTRARNANT